MQIDVRPFTGEARDFFDAAERAFSSRLRDEDLAAFEPLFERDRAIAAYDGDRIVGTAGILSFDLSVPGAMLPAAGVTVVGVHPTHRRRGVLRRMMAAQLEAVHDREEPLAALWASEGAIYQRFGYGLGTLDARVSVERSRNAFRVPHAPAGTLRFIEVDEARRVLPPIYDAVAPTRPGFFNRTPAFWDAEVFHDPEHWRDGASAAWYVVHETDGKADAYARYRVKHDWDDAGPGSKLMVQELIAANPAAHLDVWRFLLDVDLMRRVETAHLAPDDPILLAAAEPRALGIGLSDGLWLRVVDIAAALGGRRYEADGSLVLEVADAMCPWNAGRWLLEVRDGSGSASPTSSRAEVACDITDVAAAYLGAVSFTRLADAKRATQLTQGSLDRADAMFRTVRAPWCPKVF